MNPRRRAAVLAILLYGCGVRSMIYPVPPVAVPSPAPGPLTEVPLDSEAGRLGAWFLGQRPAERPLVVYFHGNAENLETLRQSGLFAAFDRLGADVLAIDYPGYGRSAGEPSETANLAAAETALAWATRDHRGRPVVVAGWSLGAAVAIQLAARHPESVDRLILLSAWSTLRALAGEHYPAFMVGALLRERYDSLAAAASIRCPTLVVHGEADTIIPARQGEALARALGERARFVALPGAGHNDLLGEPAAWSQIRAFLVAPRDRCQSIPE
jgi:pimeloyl-ACP methyl ester carboxylesterase